MIQVQQKIHSTSVKVYGVIVILLLHTHFVFSAAFGNGLLVKNLVQKYKKKRAEAGDGSYSIPCVARAYGQQKQRNSAKKEFIMNTLASTTNLPKVLQYLIVLYAHSGWFLKNRFNIFTKGSLVSRIALTNFPSKHDFCSYNEDKTECKIWNVSTGQITNNKARAQNIIEPNIQDLQPTTDKEDILSFTRCKKYRVMTDNSTQLKVWSGMSFLNAEMSHAIRYFELKNNTIYGLPNVFLSSTFSLCCNYVAAGTLDGKVIILDRENLIIQHILSHNTSVTALQVFSFPEGEDGAQLLLAGLADGSVCVWQGVFNAEDAQPRDIAPVHYHPAPLPEQMIDIKEPSQTSGKQLNVHRCYSCILGCCNLCKKR